MTQSFDEKDMDLAYDKGFDHGAQSKQAEIDELKHKIKCEREISLFADKLCCELQKRIDDSIKLLRGKSIDEVYKAIRVLKGTTNEQ